MAEAFFGAVGLSCLAVLYADLMAYNGLLFRWGTLLQSMILRGKPFDLDTGTYKPMARLRLWGQVNVYGWQYYVGMVLGGCVPCASFWWAVGVALVLPGPWWAAVAFPVVVYRLTELMLRASNL